MRFVHIADVHLDAPFARHAPGTRGRLQDASREVFRRAVSIAREEQADAFLNAGDLFDGDRLALATERFLADQLGRLDEAGIAVVYATGNHDPGDRGAHAGRMTWPANTTVARGPEPVRVTIRDQGGTPIGFVSAVGHAHGRVSEDLSRALRPAGDGSGLPEIALLHAQVHGSASADQHDRYAPAELAALRRAGFDYWALGHVHRHQMLSEDPAVVYPGSSQGLSIRETGPRGVVVVDAEPGGRIRTEFRDIAPVRWEVVEIRDPVDERNLESLVARITGEWAARRGADPGARDAQWIVRVRIRGQTPLASELRREDGRSALGAELQDALGLLDVEVLGRALVPPVEWEEHEARRDVLGETLRLVKEVREDPSRLGLAADQLAGAHAQGGREALTAYIRTLLEGAEAEVVTRLVDPEAR